MQKSQDSKKIKEDNLKETLKNLGIKADNLKDFDIFKKKEKKSKPSLAAVKVKRIKQENKLEKLEEDVALEQEKIKIEVLTQCFVKEVIENEENKFSILILESLVDKVKFEDNIIFLEKNKG